jgi:hypothetical protein
MRGSWLIAGDGYEALLGGSVGRAHSLMLTRIGAAA